MTDAIELQPIEPNNPGEPLGRTRFRPRDVWGESLAALRANQLRSLASGLAVFVAAAAIISVLTISASVANQVSDEFDALRATSVRVSPTKAIPPDKAVFPADAEARLKTIPGVRAGGVVVESTTKSTIAATNSSPTAGIEASVIGIDNSVLDATDAEILGHRVPAAFHSTATIAYIGQSLATRLGISENQVTTTEPDLIMIDGLAFEVAGILRSPQRLTQTDSAVIIPRTTAERLRQYEPTDYSMIVETAGGSARNVGDAIPLVLAPERLDPYVVDVPPDPNQFRKRVEGNIQSLVYAMAALSALVGAISIASAAYNGVTERNNEFGLRRAIGAKPKHLRYQVITETLLTSAFAATIGEMFGLLIALTLSKRNGWTTILEPWHLAAIPTAAALLGILAGLLPAHKASRIDPSQALRLT